MLRGEPQRTVKNDIEEALIEYNHESVETSWLGLQPGDLITFDYADGTIRFGLVVRSRKAPRGTRFSPTTLNFLVNVFIATSITPSMFNIVINTLYRNRVRSTYKNTPKILSVFFGASNFRTFNAAKMENIRQIMIKK